MADATPLDLRDLRQLFARGAMLGWQAYTGEATGGERRQGSGHQDRTADLKDAAPVFHEQSKKLSTALTTLVTKLDAIGKP
ncbi:MAG: hypothetical protein ACRDP3_09240 [Streptomyces sp.]|uniref:hypothetical protein n=1 Tax=Streptomyces sp. TaxID=1931 RepID=UPI003D6B1295